MKKKTAPDISSLLMAGEEKYRTFFENSMDAILITSQDGRIYSANKAACAMIGWDEKDLIKLGRDGVAEQSAQLESALAVRRVTGRYFGEIWFKRKDGSRFPVEITSSVFSSDGNELTAMIVRDITERKNTEKALKLSEERLRLASVYSRSLIEASLDPLIIINSLGKITDVNISTEQITGVVREELIGSDFADYFTNRSSARKGYKQVFSKGSVKNYPLCVLHKSGRKVDVLFNASLYKNASGDIQGVLASARDISELKRMEEELLNSKKVLENLNQHLLEVRENERSEIALNLHDDLGQRLTAIDLDVAWLKGRVGVQTRAVIQKFNDITKLINETIDGIKEISSFLRPSILYDLGIVTAFEWQLRSLEKLSKIKCRFNYSLNNNKINDRISLILYRVLQESLTNVVRHSDASLVSVELCVRNQKVVLMIKDNGKGIEDDNKNSLTSMGISGIKERVGSVSGKVLINGRKNHGTTISVVVPLVSKLKL